MINITGRCIAVHCPCLDIFSEFTRTLLKGKRLNEKGCENLCFIRECLGNSALVLPYYAGVNWCYAAYCADNGQIIYWNNFNCHTTVRQPTTPPVFTTTAPAGCYIDGHFYPPGSDISRGEDRASNWCYGTFCSEDGNILQWDNFNCFTTLPTTIPTTTM